MKNLSTLPCLFTLANAACGFAAIVKVASFVHTGDDQFLVQAAYLILLAMVFGALESSKNKRWTDVKGLWA